MKVETQERLAPQTEEGLGRQLAPVLILVPVLRRPQNVRPLLKSIAASTPKDLYEVLFICDRRDEEEAEEIAAAALKRPWVKWTGMSGSRNYAQKINHGIELYPNAPLYFLGADDLSFKRGWLEEAERLMEERGCGVVGTNDLCNPRVMAGDHATHCLVSNEYVKRGTIDDPTKLLHEGYLHEYVDDEFVETAKARGEFVHASESVVEHLHPWVNKAPSDALYEASSERMAISRPVYEQRRALWEGK